MGQLIRLDSALRSVAASGPGIQATNDVRRQLRHLRDIYGINTAVLFPKDINTIMYTRMSHSSFHLSSDWSSLRTASNSKFYLDRFQDTFFAFAEALNTVAKPLNDFGDAYHDVKLSTLLSVLNERFGVSISASSKEN